MTDGGLLADLESADDNVLLLSSAAGLGCAVVDGSDVHIRLRDLSKFHSQQAQTAVVAVMLAEHASVRLCSPEPVTVLLAWLP